jgi:hypothetical protein
MEKHVTNLAVFYVALSAVGIMAASIVFVAVVGGGFLSGDDTAMFITSTVGTAVSSLVGILSIPGLICAYGLFKRRSWARYLSLIVGAVNLFNIPFGTALGVYTFWVLTQDEAVKLFE